MRTGCGSLMALRAKIKQQKMYERLAQTETLNTVQDSRDNNSPLPGPEEFRLRTRERGGNRAYHEFKGKNATVLQST